VKRIINLLVLVIFCAVQANAYPAVLAYMPEVGQMVAISEKADLPLPLGIEFHKNNPFNFNFVLSRTGNNDPVFIKSEAEKVAKYFFAALTMPAKDLWVNLSPYEQNRITTEDMARTELGKDLLGEDYVLKQLAASLTYPETEQGKRYWQAVNNETRGIASLQKSLSNNRRDATLGVSGGEQSFNKIWIVPGEMLIEESRGKARIAKATLKVLIDQDYLAMQKNNCTLHIANCKLSGKGIRSSGNLQSAICNLQSAQNVQAFKRYILPSIEQEVNHGKRFAHLRQIYYAVMLAGWFKRKLHDTVLAKTFFDQNKVKGSNNNDPAIREKIYNEYVKAFKAGVYNYVKAERVGANDHSPAYKISKRQYFSGGAMLQRAVENVPVVPGNGHAGGSVVSIVAAPFPAEDVTRRDPGGAKSDTFVDILDNEPSPVRPGVPIVRRSMGNGSGSGKPRSDQMPTVKGEVPAWYLSSNEQDATPDVPALPPASHKLIQSSTAVPVVSAPIGSDVATRYGAVGQGLVPDGELGQDEVSTKELPLLEPDPTPDPAPAEESDASLLNIAADWEVPFQDGPQKIPTDLAQEFAGGLVAWIKARIIEADKDIDWDSARVVYKNKTDCREIFSDLNVAQSLARAMIRGVRQQAERQSEIGEPNRMTIEVSSPHGRLPIRIDIILQALGDDVEVAIKPAHDYFHYHQAPVQLDLLKRQLEKAKDTALWYQLTGDIAALSVSVHECRTLFIDDNVKRPACVLHGVMKRMVDIPRRVVDPQTSQLIFDAIRDIAQRRFNDKNYIKRKFGILIQGLSENNLQEALRTIILGKMFKHDFTVVRDGRRQSVRKAEIRLVALGDGVKMILKIYDPGQKKDETTDESIFPKVITFQRGKTTSGPRASYGTVPERLRPQLNAQIDVFYQKARLILREMGIDIKDHEMLTEDESDQAAIALLAKEGITGLTAEMLQSWRRAAKGHGHFSKGKVFFPLAYGADDRLLNLWYVSSGGKDPFYAAGHCDRKDDGQRLHISLGFLLRKEPDNIDLGRIRDEVKKIAQYEEQGLAGTQPELDTDGKMALKSAFKADLAGDMVGYALIRNDALMDYFYEKFILDAAGLGSRFIDRQNFVTAFSQSIGYGHLVYFPDYLSSGSLTVANNQTDGIIGAECPIKGKKLKHSIAYNKLTLLTNEKITRLLKETPAERSGRQALAWRLNFANTVWRADFIGLYMSRLLHSDSAFPNRITTAGNTPLVFGSKELSDATIGLLDHSGKKLIITAMVREVVDDPTKGKRPIQYVNREYKFELSVKEANPGLKNGIMQIMLKCITEGRSGEEVVCCYNNFTGDVLPPDFLLQRVSFGTVDINDDDQIDPRQEHFFNKAREVLGITDNRFLTEDEADRAVVLLLSSENVHISSDILKHWRKVAKKEGGLKGRNVFFILAYAPGEDNRSQCLWPVADSHRRMTHAAATFSKNHNNVCISTRFILLEDHKNVVTHMRYRDRKVLAISEYESIHLNGGAPRLTSESRKYIAQANVEDMRAQIAAHGQGALQMLLSEDEVFQGLVPLCRGVVLGMMRSLPGCSGVKGFPFGGEAIFSGVVNTAYMYGGDMFHGKEPASDDNVATINRIRYDIVVKRLFDGGVTISFLVSTGKGEDTISRKREVSFTLNDIRAVMVDSMQAEKIIGAVQARKLADGQLPEKTYQMISPFLIENFLPESIRKKQPKVVMGITLNQLAKWLDSAVAGKSVNDKFSVRYKWNGNIDIKEVKINIVAVGRDIKISLSSEAFFVGLPVTKEIVLSGAIAVAAAAAPIAIPTTDDIRRSLPAVVCDVPKTMIHLMRAKAPAIERSVVMPGRLAALVNDPDLPISYLGPRASYGNVGIKYAKQIDRRLEIFFEKARRFLEEHHGRDPANNKDLTEDECDIATVGLLAQEGIELTTDDLRRWREIAQAKSLEAGGLRGVKVFFPLPYGEDKDASSRRLWYAANDRDEELIAAAHWSIPNNSVYISPRALLVAETLRVRPDSLRVRQRVEDISRYESVNLRRGIPQLTFRDWTFLAIVRMADLRDKIERDKTLRPQEVFPVLLSENQVIYGLAPMCQAIALRLFKKLLNNDELKLSPQGKSILTSVVNGCYARDNFQRYNVSRSFFYTTEGNPERLKGIIDIERRPGDGSVVVTVKAKVDGEKDEESETHVFSVSQIEDVRREGLAKRKEKMKIKQEEAVAAAAAVDGGVKFEQAGAGENIKVQGGGSAFAIDGAWARTDIIGVNFKVTEVVP